MTSLQILNNKPCRSRNNFKYNTSGSITSIKSQVCRSFVSEAMIGIATAVMHSAIVSTCLFVNERIIMSIGTR